MQGGHAFLVGAMRATIKVPACFDAVADNFASAVLTFRRQRMNRAFKAIEIMRNARYDDF